MAFVTLIQEPSQTVEAAIVQETAPNLPSESPATKAYFLLGYFAALLVAITIISLLVFWWYTIQKKRQQRQAQSEEEIDLNGDQNSGWDALTLRNASDDLISTITFSPTVDRSDDDPEEEDPGAAMTYSREVEITVTSEVCMPAGPEIPLSTYHWITDEDIDLSHVPPPQALITTTCSGPITPVRSAVFITLQVSWKLTVAERVTRVRVPAPITKD